LKKTFFHFWRKNFNKFIFILWTNMPLYEHFFFLLVNKILIPIFNQFLNDIVQNYLGIILISLNFLQTEIAFFPELLNKYTTFNYPFFLLHNIFLFKINLIVFLNFWLIMNYSFPSMKSILFFMESNFLKECILYGWLSLFDKIFLGFPHLKSISVVWVSPSRYIFS